MPVFTGRIISKQDASIDTEMFQQRESTRLLVKEHEITLAC